MKKICYLLFLTRVC